MIRYFLTAVVVALVLAAPAGAKKVVIDLAPVEKLFHADAVAIGKFCGGRRPLLWLFRSAVATPRHL